MSRWRHSVLPLGIDGGAVAADWQGTLTLRDAATNSPPMAPDSETGHPLATALRELLGTVAVVPRPSRIRALVGADLCRHWTLVAPAGVASLRELQSVAAARCSQLFGGRSDEWAVVADWSLSKPFVCAAVPAPTARAVQAAAARAGLALQIESAVLAAVSRLEPWLPKDGWSAWHSPSSLVLLLRRRGRLAWLQTHRRQRNVSTRALIDEASGHISRHCLRSGEPAPSSLTWLGEAKADLPGPGHTDGIERRALEVTAVRDLPKWQHYAADTREAQWAAALATAT